MASVTLEGIERLIHEADTKFEDKFRQATRGVATNLNAYSDRTYNLRQQVAHNTQLTSDPHFMTMLQDVERLLSTEYTVRGELDKKLYALLAGLLKTLLRETVALPNYSARKIQLEMTWQWYNDKKGKVLEWSMGREEHPASGSQPKGGSSHASPVNVDPGSFAGIGDLPSTDATSSRLSSSKFREKAEKVHIDAPEAPPSTVNSLGFTKEASDGREHALIAKKLCLYKKRNLTKSERLRQEVRSGSAQNPAATEASQVRIVYTKDAQRRRGKTPGEAKRDEIKGLEKTYGPSGPPSYLHHSSQSPHFTTVSDPAKEVDDKLNQAVAASQQHWVAHMAKQLEEQHDAMEMRDSMTLFAFNQARVDEESSRRLEAGKYASQAGRTCHTLLRREPPAPAQNRSGAEGDQSAKEPFVPVTVRSTLPSSNLPTEELGVMLGMNSYTGTDTSLSPYDNYQPTPLDERKLQALLSRIRGPDAVKEDVRARLGLKSPHPNAMAATSTQNTPLDVSTAPEAKVTNASVPNSGVPVMELLYPALSVEDDVPSLARLQQMRMVERIRECFARTRGKDDKGFHVPRKTIERAVMTPDDRPFEECIRLLPVPGADFPSNPTPANDKKKRKGSAKGKPKK